MNRVSMDWGAAALAAGFQAGAAFLSGAPVTPGVLAALPALRLGGWYGAALTLLTAPAWWLEASMRGRFGSGLAESAWISELGWDQWGALWGNPPDAGAWGIAVLGALAAIVSGTIGCSRRTSGGPAIAWKTLAAVLAAALLLTAAELGIRTASGKNFSALAVPPAAWLPVRLPPLRTAGIAPGAVEIECEVLAVSPGPDPVSADYPNCDTALEVRVGNLLRGEGPDDRLMLILPLFRDRKGTPAARLAVGSKLRVAATDEARTSASRKATQLANTLENFDLPMYYAERFTPIFAYSPVVWNRVGRSSRPYRDAWAEPLNPPPPDGAETVARRARRMAADRERLNTRLALFRSGHWAERAARELPKLTAGMPRDEKNAAWGRVGRGWFSLAADFELDDYRDDWIGASLEPLKALNDLLRFHRIDLMVAIVPDLDQTAFRVLFPAFRECPDRTATEIAARLNAEGIEAVDFSSELVARAPEFELCFAYDMRDPHPDRGAMEVMTDELARRLADYQLPRNLPAGTPRFVEKPSPTRRWPIRAPGFPTGPIAVPEALDAPPAEPENSPVLALGNSFANTPSPLIFARLLAAKTGIAPYCRMLAGSGLYSTVIQRLLISAGTELTGRRVCVMPLGVRHFRSVNWQNARELNRRLRMLSGKCR